MSRSALSEEQIRKSDEVLRSKIEAVYRQKQADRSLKSGKNMLPGIRDYFPQKLDFATAEKILKAAGFDVQKHANVEPHPGLDYRDEVFGVLVLEKGMPRSTKAVISLIPGKTGDYGAVSKVEAAISVTFV